MHRLEAIILCLEEIIDDDDEINDLIISTTDSQACYIFDPKKLPKIFPKFQNFYYQNHTQNTDDLEDKFHEMEQLLEIHIVKLRDIKSQAKRQIEAIKSTRATINIKHDVLRNIVMLDNLDLNRWHLSVMIWTLPLAAFGMNFNFGFGCESDGPLFPFYVVCIIAVGAIFRTKRYLNRKNLSKFKQMFSQGRVKRR